MTAVMRGSFVRWIDDSAYDRHDHRRDLVCDEEWGREAKLFAVTMIGAALLNITLKLTFKRA